MDDALENNYGNLKIDILLSIKQDIFWSGDISHNYFYKTKKGI